ncbi:MAG: DNA polymerase/3'-5' exonuclease PolX [Candidatus Bathyarchaeota archaeon]|nr:MAG: DNA polymerase/3'-5' exonuclease PolX [Candidatus Bathyarchaeota archaeon]
MTHLVEVRENLQISRILQEIGEIHAIRGELFRSRAYLKAARNILTLTENLRQMHEEGKLQTIPGIGRGISEIIEEFLASGDVKYLKDLRASLPPGVHELTALEGIGPKIAFKLSQELGVESIEQLETAARTGKIQSLKGFSSKSEENVLKAIERHRKTLQHRLLLGQVLWLIEEIRDHLADCRYILKVEAAGSARRMCETVGDLDILVASAHPEKAIKHFASMPQITRILSKGTTRSSVVFGGSFQVDIRVVSAESFGAALQYFTGSKDHNIKLRTLAVKQGYKLSEYGLFRRKDDTKAAGETEESVYHNLGLPYICPELREDRGEIEAAVAGELPELISLEDVQGDLHVHSDWSDGTATLREIAEAALSLGLAYVAICDHTRSLGIARGLDEERLKKQTLEIDKLNKGFEEFRLLKGVEANIMSDGNLDISNHALKELDLVVASVHSGFKGDEEKLTNRILSAINHENVSIIGHPTGRLIQRRQPLPIDFDKVFSTAAEQNVLLEINAFPNRLDLNDVNSRAAQERGVKMAIGTDAHAVNQLGYLDLGVAVARRGWITPKNVVNTLDVAQLVKQLHQ